VLLKAQIPVWLSLMLPPDWLGCDGTAERHRAEHDSDVNRQAAPTNPWRQSHLCSNVDGDERSDPREPGDQARGEGGDGVACRREENEGQSGAEGKCYGHN